MGRGRDGVGRVGEIGRGGGGGSWVVSGPYEVEYEDNQVTMSWFFTGTRTGKS